MQRRLIFVFALPKMFLPCLYIWPIVWLQIQLFYWSYFPWDNPLRISEASFHCLLVSNFAVMISCAILCMWLLHQSSRISFLVFGVLKFHDYEFWYQPFFFFFHLLNWVLEKPSSYGTLCTSPLKVLFLVFFDDFLLTLFPVLSLLNCYNQKLDFLHRWSELLILFPSQPYVYLLYLICGGFPQLYLLAILLLFVFISVIAVCKTLTVFWVCLLK